MQIEECVYFVNYFVEKTLNYLTIQVFSQFVIENNAKKMRMCVINQICWDISTMVRITDVLS